MWRYFLWFIGSTSLATLEYVDFESMGRKEDTGAITD